jgi:hypothetical protein
MECLAVGLRTGQVMKQHGFTQHGFSFFELTDVIHLLQHGWFWQYSTPA